MRISSNQHYKGGQLRNGYDYDLQCWVKAGKVQRCEHPVEMDCRCMGKLYQRIAVTEVRKSLGL